MKNLFKNIASFLGFTNPFTNTGKKIKTLTVVMFYVLNAVFIAAGFVMISQGIETTQAFLSIVLLIFLNYYLSLFSYGFGELVDGKENE